MSSSENEIENFCYYGQPLPPYEEDTFPKRKLVKDQIATDDQGRRRFHGAFTGGFSAGFFNTVGSLEGWKPSEFKSSRHEKANKRTQKPQDFMDDEDLGEHGISPQVVKATQNFSTSQQKEKQIFHDGPIPGVPVLQSLLTSGNKTIGYLLLRNMKVKDKLKEQQDGTTGRIYGCEIPKAYESINSDLHENNEVSENKEVSANKEYFKEPKQNTFGLGYKGLDKDQFSKLNIPSKYSFTDKNKKVSIAGQAFGVGAFENEDNDIYSKDDMSNYDFELGPEKPNKKQTNISSYGTQVKFVQAKKSLLKTDHFAPPQIPFSFTGKHKTKKSRFEIIKENPETTTSKINPMVRAKYLGEELSHPQTKSKTLNCDLPEIKELNNKEESQPSKSGIGSSVSFFSDKFVTGGQSDEHTDALKPVKKMSATHLTQQIKDAVNMKMFGPLTRNTTDWQPCVLLCKRFNVPVPLFDKPKTERKRTSNLIFEYQKFKEENENSLNSGITDPKTINTDNDIERNKSEPCSNFESEKNEGEKTCTGESKDIDGEEPLTNDKADSFVKTREENDCNTNENLVKDVTERIDVEKNIDLFKAVFSSSDDSDSDEESNQKSNKSEEMEKNIKTENNDEKVNNFATSYDSLPKINPMKAGILSNIEFHKFSRPNASSSNSSPQIIKQEDIMLVDKEPVYGPKIPEVIPVTIDKKDSISSGTSEEEWVEIKERKKKKEKKHKHKKDRKHKKKKLKH